MKSATIAVCICTYKRPAELRRILDEITKFAPDWPQHDVFVVDNEASPATAEVVAAYAGYCYVAETTPGIAAARNAALSATRSYDLIVFIDDDEIPTSAWLTNLVAPFSREDITAVGGPVISVPSTRAQRRLLEWGFIQRPTRTSGVTSLLLSTNNVAFRRDALDRMHLPRFDLAFNTTGGEDSDFFARMREDCRGLSWWATAAEVIEVLGRRETVSWVLKRGVQEGAIETRLALGRRASRLLLLGGGLARCCLALIRVPVWAVFRRRQLGQAVRLLTRGCGQVGAAAGLWRDVYGG